MIREATAADTPRLIEMTTRFLVTTRYGRLFAPDPERIAALVAVVLKHGAIFVCEVVRFNTADWADAPDQRIVGMLALAAVPHPLTGEFYADEQAWWVEPEHRGGSIGPRLLQAAEHWARVRDLTCVKMVAPIGSDVGRYYERTGYESVEVTYVKMLTR